MKLVFSWPGFRQCHFEIVSSRPTMHSMFAAQRGQEVGDTVRPAVTMTTVHVRSGGPNSPTGSPGGFWAPHTGGAQFVLMDGSTHWISTDVNIETFRALAGRNDGVVIGAL